MYKKEKKKCSNPECGKVFVAKVYNAVYCSPECRRIVTNKNLLANYYEKKNNKNKKRICKTPKCGTVLSRYNKEKICENCKRERYIKRLMSWGWSEKQARGE